MFQEDKQYLTLYNALGKKKFLPQMSELAEKVYTKSVLACGKSISDLLSKALKPDLVYHHTVA